MQPTRSWREEIVIGKPFAPPAALSAIFLLLLGLDWVECFGVMLLVFLSWS